MENRVDYIGYLEYHGDLVNEGIMDARKTARALVGFDGALRHFLGLEYEPLRGIDYEIPVLIKPGSWQALVPTSIEQWVLAALGAVVAKYALTAVTQIAKNDFKDVSTKKIFVGALRSIQWMIRIGKHLGNLRQRRFSSVKWRNGNTEVGIPNESGEYLYVPKTVLDFYSITPPRILSDVASLIEPGRQLRVAVRVDGRLEIEGIAPYEKGIFFVSEEESDILFPNLEHGQEVTLEGVLTRGNENTNSLGLRYQEHILNCVPREGSIVRFKDALFLKCRVSGSVSRADDSGMVCQKKPKLVVDTIEPLEAEQPGLSLFEE